MNVSTRAAAIFALATSILSTVSVHAAVVPNPANNDYFLGFRATGGQGASVSYLVKLGNATAFPILEGTQFTLSNIGNIGLDLAATYGSNWFSRSDLSWGIFGTSTSASSTVYGSRERLTLGVRTDPWPTLTATARNGVDSAISSVLNGTGGYRNSTSTSNSSVATLQNNSAAAVSYAFQVGTAGTSDFGSLSGWTSIEGDFGDGAAATVLDLWRLSNAGVTYRGAFSIDNSGAVSYRFSTTNVAPVPEPTTSLWGLSALGALGVTRARRRASAHAQSAA